MIDPQTETLIESILESGKSLDEAREVLITNKYTEEKVNEVLDEYRQINIRPLKSKRKYYVAILVLVIVVVGLIGFIFKDQIIPMSDKGQVEENTSYFDDTEIEEATDKTKENLGDIENDQVKNTDTVFGGESINTFTEINPILDQAIKDLESRNLRNLGEGMSLATSSESYNYYYIEGVAVLAVRDSEHERGSTLDVYYYKNGEAFLLEDDFYSWIFTYVDEFIPSPDDPKKISFTTGYGDVGALVESTVLIDLNDTPPTRISADSNGSMGMSSEIRVENHDMSFSIKPKMNGLCFDAGLSYEDNDDLMIYDPGEKIQIIGLESFSSDGVLNDTTLFDNPIVVTCQVTTEDSVGDAYDTRLFFTNLRHYQDGLVIFDILDIYNQEMKIPIIVDPSTGSFQ